MRRLLYVTPIIWRANIAHLALATARNRGGELHHPTACEDPRWLYRMPHTGRGHGPASQCWHGSGTRVAAPHLEFDLLTMLEHSVQQTSGYHRIAGANQNPNNNICQRPFGGLRHRRCGHLRPLHSQPRIVRSCPLWPKCMVLDKVKSSHGFARIQLHRTGLQPCLGAARTG
jgi:hypothetical protein